MLPDKYRYIRHLALWGDFHKVGFSISILEQKPAGGVAKRNNSFGPVYITRQLLNELLEFLTVYSTLKIMGIGHDMIMGRVGMTCVIHSSLDRLTALSNPFLRILLAPAFQMYSAETSQQDFRLQIAAHCRQNLSICIPFAQHFRYFFSFLCCDPVCLVQNKHGCAADLLLHQPVG
ncbi:hypothetical protein D3C85_1445610 [compost metagenome]